MTECVLYSKTECVLYSKTECVLYSMTEWGDLEYLCVYVCIYMYIYTQVSFDLIFWVLIFDISNINIRNTYTHTCAGRCGSSSTSVCVWERVCVYTYISIYIHTHTHRKMSVSLSEWVSVCVCVCVYTHTGRCGGCNTSPSLPTPETRLVYELLLLLHELLLLPPCAWARGVQGVQRCLIHGPFRRARGFVGLRLYVMSILYASCILYRMCSLCNVNIVCIMHPI